MTKNILNMPKKHIGFAQAREILRDMEAHDLDAIDAAFDVLIYSDRPEDQVLCEAAVTYMWERPKVNGPVILVLASFMIVATVSLAAIFSKVIQ
jgi:hypothetical protein